MPPARVAKLVDAGDLKSPRRKSMRVRLPPRAPITSLVATSHGYMRREITAHIRDSIPEVSVKALIEG